MLERGTGSIVNTSSVVSFAPLPVQPAYATSKGGINSLTYSVATSYGRHGIRCNAICPGFIVNETTSGAYSDEFRATALAAQPSNRLGRPEDIAALVSFLASDDAAYINGQVISVDGGLTVPGALYPHIIRMQEQAPDPV
jgi:NAD(P)-dependent dehydrogenase (short-subunit alcohol dehydrogenase family)